MYQLALKKDISSNNNNNSTTLIPEQITSRDNIFNKISTKVDSMKIQVNEMKSSYIENIKEEAERRRNNFYNQNLAQVYLRNN